MRIDYDELLDLLCDLVIIFSRRDGGYVLAGYHELDGWRDAYRIIRRLEDAEYVQRRGNGGRVRFRLTPKAFERVAVRDPARHWNRRWDGKWRLVSYDLPEIRRRDRVMIWRALRARKLGFIQKSVWIWPHDVEPVLREIVRTEGVPECFLGLEGDRVLLCSHAEIVEAAWNFEEIGRWHQVYLNNSVATPATAKRARGLGELTRLARVERRADREAFELDPLLPRELSPKKYRGEEVEERHQRFLVALRHRAAELCEG